MLISIQNTFRELAGQQRPLFDWLTCGGIRTTAETKPCTERRDQMGRLMARHVRQTPIELRFNDS
jgi:hypothetical protein